MALPGHRDARPLVGAGDHRRRREDADPAHRAHPAHVPVGVVRRRLRAHRDGLGRHLPRPRQHRDASSAASAGRASTSSSTSGTSTARRCPPGERGEVVLRGPKVFKGYWRDPDATAAAFAGGWFHTGDIGVRDDDGYLYIVDRLKDMIVSGRREHRQLRGRARAVRARGGGRSRGRRPARRAVGRGAGRASSSCAPAPTTTPRRAHRALPRRSSRKFKVPEGTWCSSTRCRATRRARS